MNDSMTQDQPFDASTVAISQQRQFNGEVFPLVFQSTGPPQPLQAALRWLGSHRDELDAQLAEHGAILFRGFGLTTAEDFDAFVRAFEYENFPYDQSLSNAVRSNLTPRVFTANEAPPDVRIYLHHEMAQTISYPGKLFFFCEKPAERGGATPLCRSDVLLENLERVCPDFVRDCERKGLRYTLTMPDEADSESGMGRSWKSTFSVETRPEAEKRMREMGYTWQWMPDGSLKTSTPKLAAVREIAPGRKVFFNQLTSFGRSTPSPKKFGCIISGLLSSYRFFSPVPAFGFKRPTSSSTSTLASVRRRAISLSRFLSRGTPALLAARISR